jgi:polygalacturonase
LIDGITISTPATGKHTDGIDPDSCDDVHITRCTINTADDHISVKSGKAPQGIKYNRPSTNVLIDHNTFGIGGGVAMGSETSGGIYNIQVLNNTFSLTGNVVRMKSCPDYGAGIENVTYASNTVAAGGIAIFVDLSYECKGTGGGSIPIVRNINITDLTGASAVAGSIDCIDKQPCNINMDGVKLTGGIGWAKCNHVKGITNNVSPKPCY